LWHPSRSDASSPHKDVAESQAPIVSTINDTGINDFDMLWDSNIMSQNALSDMLFDFNFPLFDTSPSIQPPPTSKFAKFSSRLPSLDVIEDDNDNDEEDDEEDVQGSAGEIDEPWYITKSGYERFSLKIQQYSQVLPAGYSLPSRNTLARYLEKYLKCVSEFLPFIHPASFSFEQKNIELSLAIAALGSLYCYERPKSYELYVLARAITQERTRRRELLSTSTSLSGQIQPYPDKVNDLERIQTLIILIIFASWTDKIFLPDALSMGSQLAMLVRQNGISQSDEMPTGADWVTWVVVEERRRTLLAAYALFNLQSIAFNTPPLILSVEVGVCLPGCSEQWKSKSAAQWQQTTGPIERHFKGGLRSLFDGTGIPNSCGVTSIANYMLIHGILQQIYMDSHGITGSIRPESIKSFENALRLWQLSWEYTPESTLDALSIKGPFGLTATALFRLAYIRLSSESSPCRSLLSREIRYVIGENSVIDRSPPVDRAVLHAAHALSIPVRLGIATVAQTKTPIWSIEHSLCSLECALLLKNWLEMISATIRSFSLEGLRKVEKRLLDIITEIIKETSFADTIDIIEDDASHFQRMAGIVIKIWAQMFQGIQIYEIDSFIGASLQLLADTSPG
jgi:hypothetical protein